MCTCKIGVKGSTACLYQYPHDPVAPVTQHCPLEVHSDTPGSPQLPGWSHRAGSSDPSSPSGLASPKLENSDDSREEDHFYIHCFVSYLKCPWSDRWLLQCPRLLRTSTKAKTMAVSQARICCWVCRSLTSNISHLSCSRVATHAHSRYWGLSCMDWRGMWQASHETVPFVFSCSSLARADLQTWSMSLSRSCQRFPLKQVCTWPRKVRFCFREYVWEKSSSKASSSGSKICFWSTGL